MTLESAVAAALDHAEEHGAVSDAWLAEQFPELWQEVRQVMGVETHVCGGVRIGAHVGPFRVLRRIGRGGIGSVFEAERLAGGEASIPDRRVALKVLRPEWCGNAQARRRLQREAEAARRVNHPNVVRLIDSGVASVDGDERAYLAMELVGGATLREHIVAGDLSVTDIVRVGAQIAAALAALHDVNMVHRDVKPDNVIVTPDGDAMLLDLGLAWLQDELSRLSLTGDFVGTFAYAAPEQITRQDTAVHPAADLFALGVTLFEMLTGESPWSDMRGIGAAARARARLALPSDRVAGLSSALDELVGELLQLDPERRPASAAVVAERLATLNCAADEERDPFASRGLVARVGVDLARVRERDGRALIVSDCAQISVTPNALLIGGRARSAGCDAVNVEDRSDQSENGLVSAWSGGRAAVDALSIDLAGAALRRALVRIEPDVLIVPVLDSDDLATRTLARVAADAASQLTTLVVIITTSSATESWLMEMGREAHVSVASDDVERGYTSPPTPATSSASLNSADARLLAAVRELGDVASIAELERALDEKQITIVRGLTRLAREHGLVEWIDETSCRAVRRPGRTNNPC